MGAITRRWAPRTRCTLRHNTASIMKDLIPSAFVRFGSFSFEVEIDLLSNYNSHAFFRLSYKKNCFLIFGRILCPNSHYLDC